MRYFNHLAFKGDISGGSLTLTSAVEDRSGLGSVIDNDETITITAGDYFRDEATTYAGFTISFGDGAYAVFGPDSEGSYLIPHDGSLTGQSFPAVGETFAITVQDGVVVVNCFLTGTRIATPLGPVAVEALVIGQPILTADGRAVAVKWVGRQTVSTCLGAAPVRLGAGALGGGLPLRDLVVTADHALLIDGFLINAGALVNGSSIDLVGQAALGARATFFHVETDAHDIILAEGTPAESFIDYAGRQVFDNYAEYLARYGEDRPIAENSAPRITSARMLPTAICARLIPDRAA